MFAMGIMVLAGASNFIFPDRCSNAHENHHSTPKDISYTERSSIISCWWSNMDVYPLTSPAEAEQTILHDAQ